MIINKGPVVIVEGDKDKISNEFYEIVIAIKMSCGNNFTENLLNNVKELINI